MLATVDNMYFNLIPLLRKKPAALFLQVGTNDSSNETPFQIYDKLLIWSTLLKKAIQIVMSYCLHQSIDLMIETQLLNSLLSESSLNLIYNSNIGHSVLGMHCLDLNEIVLVSWLYILSKE